MNAASLKSWIVALSSAALLGCETPSQNASLQCGAGGAAAGYLLCKALGRPDSECIKAAAVIGAGGAAICYNYASNLERRRKELAGRENNLDARIKYVRGLNEDSQQLNTDLSKRVAVVSQSTDDLVVQIRQKKVSAERLARERKARDDEVAAANVQVAKGAEALNEVKVYRAQNRTASPDLDVAITKQEQLLADAKRNVALLSAQRARVV